MSFNISRIPVIWPTVWVITMNFLICGCFRFVPKSLKYYKNNEQTHHCQWTYKIEMLHVHIKPTVFYWFCTRWKVVKPSKIIKMGCLGWLLWLGWDGSLGRAGWLGPGWPGPFLLSGNCPGIIRDLARLGWLAGKRLGAWLGWHSWVVGLAGLAAEGWAGWAGWAWRACWLGWRDFDEKGKKRIRKKS